MAAQIITATIGGGSQILSLNETLPAPFANQPLSVIFSPAWSFVNGAAAVANGINQWFQPSLGTVTLAGSASATYTLTALTDALGRSLTMAGGVRAWGILVTSRTAGDYLTVGAAGTNPWVSFMGGTTPTLKVWDFHFMGVKGTDKYVVTASSNEQLKITNSGSNPITFYLIVLGCES